MKSFRNVSFVIAFVLVLSLTVTPSLQNSYAHNTKNLTDPPGPNAPKIRTYIVFDGISLNQDMDDGGGNAELVFTRLIGHKGHDEHNISHQEIPFDWDLHKRSDSFAKIDWKEWHKNDDWRTLELESFYYHDECSPMSEIVYSFDLKESDQSTANTIASGVVTVVGAAAAVPGAGWVTAGIIAAVGGVVTFLVGLNGDEELGTAVGSKTAPEEDITTPLLKGADGSGNIHWSIYTVEIDDPEGECVSPTDSRTSMQLDLPNQSYGMTEQKNQDYAIAVQQIDDLIDSSKQLILLNSDSKMEEGLTDISEKDFALLKSQTPDKVVRNVDSIFLLASESVSENSLKDNAMKKRDIALVLLEKEGHIESLDLYRESFIDLINASKPQIKKEIPAWIKTNALWWSQNQIDDKTFALAIGFLVKENIIQVGSNKADPSGSLIVSDNLVIPAWIQNNAKWWGEGKITDEDFKQGIQFMVQEEIISFQGNQKGQINPPSLTLETGPIMEKETKQKILQHFADALLANNAGLRQLLEMQNFVGDSLDDFTKEAWNNYSENKNQETMESAILLEDLTRLMKEDSSKTITAMKDSNENIELFFKEVKTNDFDDFVLKNNAEEKLENLNEVSNVKSEKDLEDAEKNTKKIDGLIGNSIENAKQLGGIIEGERPEVIYAQSSRYSFAFEPGSIEERPSSSYGIDSRYGAKTCNSDSVCDANKGETCSSRDPETSGKCIPTWFGICHAWAPSCVMDVYRTSKELVYSGSSYSSPITAEDPPIEDPPTQDPPIEESDTDLDNDGITNLQDSCPNEPETVNGYMDSDGCPDTPPPADTTPPVISVPSNTIIESSEELTPVTFNAVSNDDVDGSIIPTCNPPSGSLFPVGITAVTCTATDSGGNAATKSFTVEVIYVDIKPPVITISSINSIESGDGFIVTYDATAEDNVDGSVTVSCNPPSGSFFPEGIHRITCTATDSAGNPATQAIDITVTRVE